MRLRALVPALAAFALSSLPSSGQAGLFSSDDESTVAALLERLPATDWSKETGGFSVVDIALLRQALGVEWPQTWPTRDDAGSEAMRAIVSVVTLMPVPPQAIATLRYDMHEAPLALLGLDVLRVDAIAERGFGRPSGSSSVLVGPALADTAAVSAALGAPDRLGPGEIPVWVPEDAAWRGPLSGSSLALVAPDHVAILGADTAIDDGIAAADGHGGAIAALPEAAALIEVAEATAGRLVALWGLHPGVLRSVMNVPESGWPADAELPEFQALGAAWAVDGGQAVSRLMLVYADAAAAEKARQAMTDRMPLLEFRGDVTVSAISVTEAAGMPVVVIESRAALPTIGDRQPLTGFHIWTRRLFVMLDIRFLEPTL
ncbi:MAG: hypothetical protein R3F55_14880 [Alphaproteobacteria bacterium]